MRHWVFPTEWAYNFSVICFDVIHVIQGCFTAIEATLENTGKLAYRGLVLHDPLLLTWISFNSSIDE